MEMAIIKGRSYDLVGRYACFDFITWKNQIKTLKQTRQQQQQKSTQTINNYTLNHQLFLLHRKKPDQWNQKSVTMCIIKSSQSCI